MTEFLVQISGFTQSNFGWITVCLVYGVAVTPSLARDGLLSRRRWKNLLWPTLHYFVWAPVAAIFSYVVSVVLIPGMEQTVWMGGPTGVLLVCLTACPGLLWLASGLLLAPSRKRLILE